MPAAFLNTSVEPAFRGLAARTRTALVPGAPFFVISSASCSSAACTHAQTLRIAAASDLQFVSSPISPPNTKNKFRRKTRRHLRSSGNFVAQIQNGASFSIFFFSADDALSTKHWSMAGFADAESL